MSKSSDDTLVLRDSMHLIPRIWGQHARSKQASFFRGPWKLGAVHFHSIWKRCHPLRKKCATSALNIFRQHEASESDTSGSPVCLCNYTLARSSKSCFDSSRFNLACSFFEKIRVIGKSYPCGTFRDNWGIERRDTSSNLGCVIPPILCDLMTC